MKTQKFASLLTLNNHHTVTEYNSVPISEPEHDVSDTRHGA